ncbi:MAG: polysaccharide deacetylase family protein, partial [Verrucomicrobiales bacterium]|nr:polysaccharide deacetylase family protein [Verrucomicrobiales bacterium]
DWLYQNPNPSPSQLGTGAPGNFEFTDGFVPDVENRISKYDASNRPGIQVALTFDDGPAEKTTPRVLDILRQHQVPATFFVLGNNVKRNPALMQRIRADGHEVGNHSWDHSSVWYLRADDQIGRSNQVIGESGELPRFFRPPYGAMGRSRKWLADKIAKKWSMETIYWSVDPQEFRRSATDEEVIRNVVSEIHDGAVVLMHDINTRTVRTLPEIIHNLKRQKIEFLTLSELKAVSKGEVLPPRRGPVQLPLSSGLPSYLTLPYLPADAGGSGIRIELVNHQPKILSKDTIRSRSGGGWELPVHSGGAVIIQTTMLGPSLVMVLIVLVATFITILAAATLGNLYGSFLVAILGLGLTRFVLAISADHVFPDDVNLWNPNPLQSTDWLVENTTTIALFAPLLLCGLILPAIFIGLQDSIGNRLISRFRLRRWFGFLAGLFLLFCGLAFVWIIGSGERIGPVQKSAFYIPVIILCTSWIIGVGGARGAESRTLTERCWPVFAALFFLLACIHGMFAVFRQDLGAVLVLLPATWLFLCYASSQASWIWRTALWAVAGLSVVWAFRFITSFLTAIHLDDYPFEIIPDVKAIKIVIAILLVLVTLLGLRSLPNATARRIGLPILGISVAIAACVQLIPINPIARKFIVPKTESRKESLYSQYLRFRSVDRDFLNSEGTQRAMEISEEQKIVDVYAMGGWFGDGFGTLPFDRSRYNFLNDYAVSTFVRGQFGLTGVLSLAAWQLSLLFYSTRLTLPRTSSRSQVTARLAFWEVAGKLSCWVIGFISIYMIVSNLGFPWAPLTGKNVFLLGLNSSSDVLETSILVFLIAAAATSVQKERRSIKS